jgi:hypothetical protein
MKNLKSGQLKTLRYVNGQNDNTNPIKKKELNWGALKSKQLLLYKWHAPCYKFEREKWDCYFEKRSISMVICDTAIPYRLTISLWRWQPFWGPRFSCFHVSSIPLLMKSCYDSQELDRIHKLWKITSTERYIIIWK